MLARILLVCLMIGLSLPVSAQNQNPAEPPNPAMLVADSVFVDGTQLVAMGNVEAIYDGTILQAGRIIYDRQSETLQIEGPVRIKEGDSLILLADSAALDRNLQNGILRGARLVMDEQLQLAAARVDRVNGRYSQLTRASVTSCQVCGPNQVPLWQIRARRVIHDQKERQLYFDGAQFRVADVPIFYFPRLRLPDPTLKRARGFLVPTSRSTTRLGFGIKMPYFIPIGDHQDVTITPYVSPVTRTMEYRYRRAFAHGGIEVRGAISRDTLNRNVTRGYIFGAGAFDLRRDFKLSFDVEATTDNAYLADYGYSSKERLDSAITLTQTRRTSYFEASLTHYQSLRDGENNATLPTIVGDVLYERRFFPRLLGGEFRAGVNAHSHYRYSNTDVVGRDVTRLTTDLSWRKKWTLPAGLRAGVTGQLWVDSFNVVQGGPLVTSQSTTATPAVAIDLRWPLLRRNARGGRDLLEPILQIGWVGGNRRNLPNDESTRVEFDEANLLSLSRFPAPDRRERGTSVAYGMRWMRQAPSGWAGGLTLGQVIRQTADSSFSTSSGLSGIASDWLVAAHVRNGKGLALWARGTLDEKDGFSKAEARLDWTRDRLGVGASYLLLKTDLAEDRTAPVAEWSLDTRYRIGRHWTTSANWRYDLASDRTAKAGFGLQYRNECAEIDFSVSRSFISTSSLQPSTVFGLTVALKGFSTGGSAKEYRRTCN